MATTTDKAKIKEAVKRRKKEVYTPVVPDMQLGFVHNNVDCIGCRACEIACKDKNGLPPGPRFRRVQYIEGGTYPDVFAYKVNMSCNHCAEPACLPTCPTGAIFKRKTDGIVDIDSTLCIGCRRCEAACPYWARHFNWTDPQIPAEEVNPVTHYLGNRPRPKGVVEKCHFCLQRTRKGREPACLEACPTGARVFGNLLDPKSEIRYILEHKNVFRLKEELGTEPKFWYYSD